MNTGSERQMTPRPHPQREADSVDLIEAENGIGATRGWERSWRGAGAGVVGMRRREAGEAAELQLGGEERALYIPK